MKKGLIFAFLVLNCLVLNGRDNGGSDERMSETKAAHEKARKLAQELHSNCHRGKFFDFISSAWTPTVLFGSAVVYEGIKNYKSYSIPSFTGIKDTLSDVPKFFMVSSAILVGCMVYNYYKPMFKRAYNRYYDAKKNCQTKIS